MFRCIRRSWKFGLVALTAGALLAGCSSANLAGLSTYGNNKLQVADISNIGDYSSERALSEAKAHFRNKDFGHSAAFYKRAVELSPNNVDAYVGLSASYDRLGRFDLADRAYAALYELDGGSAAYFNNVGYSYMLRGNLKEALKNFRRAQKIEPDNVVVANNIQILSNAAAAGRA